MLSALTRASALRPASLPPARTPTPTSAQKNGPQKAGVLSSEDGPTLRSGRPDWSFEWRNAKTGGVSTHRRHCVRSGLMKAALSATLKHAVQLNKLDEFYGLAGRILKEESLEVKSDHEANVLLEKLFARLHNNHMNIFYGRGSYNQMLGTLAHGLEKIEPTYFERLESAQDIAEVKSLVQDWVLDSASYALCEYMDFSLEHQEQIDQALTARLSSDFEIDTDALIEDFEHIDLFHDRAHEGPMEVKVHKDRQKALMGVVELMSERFTSLFSEYSKTSAGAEFLALKAELKAFAGDILDSANLDLSEARHDGVRILQNAQSVATTMALTSLIQNPSLEGFEVAAHDFLSLEARGGQALGLGERYQAWFAKDQSREAFFNAVTAPEDQLIPSLESAKYSPRQWDDTIREAFKAHSGEQRLQVVPSTLVRQLGYAVSNYMVAHDQLPVLKNIYERLFGLADGEIETLDGLQKYHAKLVRDIHNNPTNLALGSRSSQIARENMLFALETAEPLLDLGDVRGWFEHVCVTALSGYISLIPSETDVLLCAVDGAFELSSDQFMNRLMRASSSLELLQDSWIRSGALARYDAQQIKPMREKITLLISQLVELHKQVLDVGFSGEKGVGMVRQLAQDVQEHQLAWRYSSSHKEVRAAQEMLASYVPEIIALRESCLNSSRVALSPREVGEAYERILQGLIDSRDIGQTFGLKRWAAEVGAKKAHS